MKERLSVEDFKAMLGHALEKIKAREEEFSQLDAVTVTATTDGHRYGHECRMRGRDGGNRV